MSATIDIQSILNQMIAQAPQPDAATVAKLAVNAKRAAATAVCRVRKTEHKAAVLASVDGDTEKLKTITLWAPRKTKRQLYAKGYEKKFVGPQPNECRQGDDEKHDQLGRRSIVSVNAAEFVGEFDETEYDLITLEVERAKHPKEEVEYAKLQGRFIEHKPSINGFFAAPATVRFAARPNDHYAPLGDFEWADDQVPREVREKVYARNRKSRPIHNIKEHDQAHC
jgi:hypothetical protein